MVIIWGAHKHLVQLFGLSVGATLVTNQSQFNLFESDKDTWERAWHPTCESKFCLKEHGREVGMYLRTCGCKTRNFQPQFTCIYYKLRWALPVFDATKELLTYSFKEKTNLDSNDHPLNYSKIPSQFHAIYLKQVHNFNTWNEFILKSFTEDNDKSWAHCRVIVWVTHTRVFHTTELG